MHHYLLKRISLLNFVAVLIVTAAISTNSMYADMATSEWKKNAETIYDTGFMHMLRKHPEGGISLYDLDLIENDAYGAGTSEKGIHKDAVWGENKARKILFLDDPRAHTAWLYVFPQRSLKHPLTFEINGHTSQIPNTNSKGWETVRWAEFPTSWLKKGENVIELSCPEAKSENDGWTLQLARADEFEEGGGDPALVGETSFKSVNGGKSWKKSPFGPEGNDRAEYCVRISLERHIASGWLESPVIDLWKEDSDDIITRQRTIKKLTISLKATEPEGADITYLIRKGTSPGYYSEDWENYDYIGEGAAVDVVIDGQKFNRRYLQIKAVFSTENPLISPIMNSAEVTAEFKESYPVPRHKNLYVVDVYNPPVRYSSLPWEWEKWDRPELEKLRKQESLDTVVKGCRTQLEMQMKLVDYAKKRWRWTHPRPEYPKWDALSIVNRINKAGGGGMCIQQNLFFVGLCQAYGIQGRLLGVDGHEVCEVWNDEYGKWIYFDAYYPNHILCDSKTGEPLSMFELHNRYLDYFYPDRPMNWQTDYRYGLNVINEREDKPPVMRSSLSFHDHDRNKYTGFMESRILRLIPRTNFFEKTYPQPLSHFGGGYFWNGYVSWYDDRTPPRGQYAWHTDRFRDLWPDLNTVHIHVTQGYGNDRLFLHFESYTPNFCHFEVNTDDNGWVPAEERWAWLLIPGKNSVLVRSVNKSGVCGKPSKLVVNHVVMPLNEWEIE